jgi:hypothetical protein
MDNIGSASEPNNNYAENSVSYEVSANSNTITENLHTVVMGKNSLVLYVPENSSFSPNGSVKIALFRQDESANPFKQYVVPELLKPTDQNNQDLKLPLVSKALSTSEIASFVSKKIKKFLPLFLRHLACRADLETLHKMEVAIAKRKHDLANGQTADLSTTYYQNVSGGRWYWYLQWKDEKGKRKNKPLCRCEKLELPPNEKYSDKKINPYSANWSFSKRYLVEVSEEILTAQDLK